MGACACGAYTFGSCVCKHFKEHCRLSFRARPWVASLRKNFRQYKIRNNILKGIGLKSSRLGISCDILEFLEISTNIHTTRHKKSTRIKSDA